MIKVVNVIPKSLSGESKQDSEPNIAVNPANTSQIAITAFTPDPMGGSNAPIFVSTDGGNNWTLNTIVPSQAGSGTGTGDITPRFGLTGNRFYAGILRQPGSLRLNILRTASFTGASTMTVLVDRNNVDQPYTQAATVPTGPDAGKDRVYVGINDFGASGGKTATVERSLDAGAATPVFQSLRIEKRTTSGQNGPQIRTAIHTDGTIYAIFYGWRSFSSGLVTSDVIVVRDDNWASGAAPFGALTDPSDGLAGRKVTTGVQFTFNAKMGQERLGGDLSIAVDPTNSSVVFIAFCDVVGGKYTIHVRRSTNKGVTWSSDIKTLSNAKNPALAINSSGKVGLAYQQVTGTGSSQRWVTHLELTTNAFTSSTDFVLATVPASTPAPLFLPYIGDYIHLMAVGTSFFGVFSANNTPDAANFPQGVTYLRNADFATKKLLAVNNTTVVPVSIDPFFFSHKEPVFTHFTNLTVFTSFTKFTNLTLFTNFTQLTQFTKFTSLTKFTKLTLFTLFTRFSRFPIPIDPGDPIRGLEGEAEPEPFQRFGNSILTPEELDIARYPELGGIAEALAANGITRLHQLASSDIQTLSVQLGLSREDAARLLLLGQLLLRRLAQ